MSRIALYQARTGIDPAANARDLDFTGLKHDYGFGARFHTPFSTVLRIDVARSSEGTSLVFATSPVF